MTQTEKYFLFLLLINLIVVIIYVLLQLFRKKTASRAFWVRAIVMLLCPLTGIVYFFCSWLLAILMKPFDTDISDVIFSKLRGKNLVGAEVEQERNLVPLEEALYVTDKDNLRNLMLSVIKRDTQDTLAVIAMALNSEDSETAHYAASVLQGALNDFRSRVQYLFTELKAMCAEEASREGTEGYESQREKINTTGCELLEYMNKFLEQKVFLETEQRDYALLMDQAGDLFYQYEEGAHGTLYENISMRLLEVAEYDLCEKWCRRMREKVPGMLGTYTCQLKLYFTVERKNDFFQVLKELKSSSVVIDKETLELIRTFS